MKDPKDKNKDGAAEEGDQSQPAPAEGTADAGATDGGETKATEEGTGEDPPNPAKPNDEE